MKKQFSSSNQAQIIVVCYLSYSKVKNMVKIKILTVIGDYTYMKGHIHDEHSFINSGIRLGSVEKMVDTA